MKKLFTLMILLPLTLSLAGCAYLNKDKGSKSTNVQNETCNYLKRQMTYNSFSNSADSRFVAQSQVQDLREQYEEYGCS
jgi:hypothetical protein